MRAKILIPSLALTVLGLGLVGAKTVQAQDSGDGYPPMVQKLAERFGLNEDEVKTFFDETRQEHQQMMQQQREERLSQAVTDGVITEEQKQALEQKWEEHKTEREQHREEMQAWFEQQGIDPQALHQYMGFGPGGHGPGFGR